MTDLNTPAGDTTHTTLLLLILQPLFSLVKAQVSKTHTHSPLHHCVHACACACACVPEGEAQLVRVAVPVVALAVLPHLLLVPPAVAAATAAVAATVAAHLTGPQRLLAHAVRRYQVPRVLPFAVEGVVRR